MSEPLPAWQDKIATGMTYAHPALPSAPQPVGVIVSGPNHALHAVLTLFTFWACGGWAWVWLIVAANNRKIVQPVDAYGNVIPQPLTPEQIAHSETNRKVWLYGTVILMLALLFLFLAANVAALLR